MMYDADVVGCKQDAKTQTGSPKDDSRIADLEMCDL